MKKIDKIGFGSRMFIPYDVHTDLSVCLILDDNREIDFNIMIHQGSDKDGCICWFEAKEK